MKCVRDHTVEVLRSGAGYYIGTIDPEDQCPYCQLSQEYYRTEKEAQSHLTQRSFTPRHNSVEVEFCKAPHKECIRWT